MSVRQGQRGMAMMWAMLLLVAFGAFSASVLQRSRRIDLDAEGDRQRSSAFHAAQGGIAFARVQVSGNLAETGKMTREIGGYRVEMIVEPTVQGWKVSARAVPGNVMVRAILTRSAGRRLLDVTAWERLR